MAQEKMYFQKIAIGALTYFLAVMGFAYVWHLVVFDEFYATNGYFGNGDPNIALGMVIIAVQGVALAMMFSYFDIRSTRASGFVFMGLLGLFHWTLHVLSKAATSAISPLMTFVGIETVYVVIQWVALALMFDWIFAGQIRNNRAPITN